MKEEVIKWGTILQIPNPETILTIFLHVVVHYWRAESNLEYYKTHFFPQDVDSVMLHVDHKLYQKARYHVYEVNKDDYIGVWDETPFHLNFRSFHEKTNRICLDHGDYRHDFQLFLRSFLKEIKRYTVYYPSLDRLYKILTHFSLLQWKCPICRLYNEWSRELIESFLLEKNVSISPSSLLYLLTYSNKKMGESIPKELIEQCSPLNDLLKSALTRFFFHFEKIYEQTSVEPVSILNELIIILEKYTSVYTIDQIHEFEHQCALDMKNYLYDHFKFLRTKDIQIHHFPRDMMIIRDIFATIVGIWTASSSSLADGSPGILLLLFHMLFQDKALYRDLNFSQPVVVFHSLQNIVPLTRHMTPTEIHLFTDYHPLLRQTIFKT